MTCPTCERPVPDALLACPDCLEEKSKKALRAYQLDPLREVHAGRADLLVRTMRNYRHIQLFGADQTFCGLPTSSNYRRSRIRWEPAELAHICSECAVAITQLMEEACRDSG